MDKGSASNLASASCLAVGLALPAGLAHDIVLSTGLFAFSGGITNTLAIKMLFDRVPGLVGSGVIPARFREIRAKIKQLILAHFFHPAFLQQFFADRKKTLRWDRYLKGSGIAGGLESQVERIWERVASKEAIEPLVDRNVDRLLDSSVGGFLLMVGVDNVKPAVRDFVSGMLASLKERVQELARSAAPSGSPALELDEEKIIEDVRAGVDGLLEAKLQELDAVKVKGMLEDVIRDHLGWLVVWGNVFGGLLGLLALLVQERVAARQRSPDCVHRIHRALAPSPGPCPRHSS